MFHSFIFRLNNLYTFKCLFAITITYFLKFLTAFLIFFNSFFLLFIPFLFILILNFVNLFYIFQIINLKKKKNFIYFLLFCQCYILYFLILTFKMIGWIQLNTAQKHQFNSKSKLYYFKIQILSILCYFSLYFESEKF